MQSEVVNNWKKHEQSGTLVMFFPIATLRLHKVATLHTLLYVSLLCLTFSFFLNTQRADPHARTQIFKL